MLDNAHQNFAVWSQVMIISHMLELNIRVT